MSSLKDKFLNCFTFYFLWHLVTLWQSNAMFLFLNISESYLNEDPQLF